MNATLRRWIPWGVLSAAVVAGLAYTFRPQPIPVDLSPVVRGPLLVTVDEEGETRVRDVFVLSAPVTGRMRRIEADVGDVVLGDQTVLAELEPIDPAFLDLRGEARATAALQAAQAAGALAEAELAEAEAEFEFAEADLHRARELRTTDDISQRTLDDAERLYKTTGAAVATARARLDVRTFELERARAELLSPVETQALHGNCACVPLRAPVDGKVLRIVHESEGVVEAGEPLVEIGDPRDLEIVIDFLSSDAVQITPGQRVVIEQWGGAEALAGRVRRVEPFGFVKVSALGIEEQRVNVIIDLTSPPDAWARLGHGYQVEVRVVLSEGDDILKLPLTALFRNGGDWAVFAEDNGRARQRSVQVGRRSGLEAEILQGVGAGDRVIVSPSDRIIDGVRIRPRT